MEHYDARAIEAKWQRIWAEEGTWEVANPGQPGFEAEKPKAYVLEMLPYPSGEPHVGHLKTYAVGDAVAHFRRRHGFQVIHPMGYDSFGLPAENNAIKTGEHPRAATEASIESFRRQFQEWGISLDWTREISTHSPDYYRWTQWIFLRLFEQGLAYRAMAPVQWCPKDATVLAHEQVIDGRCERCGTPVEQRNLEQWFFRITDYAERLLADFDRLESWPEHVITMQRNWIGRSEGAEVTFRCEELGDRLPRLHHPARHAVRRDLLRPRPRAPRARGDGRRQRRRGRRARVRQPGRPRGRRRSAATRAAPKTGVALGRTVTNPVNGEEIPVFVADYVLMDYGTGAVMAVPAHDQRDFDFAQTYDLPVGRSYVKQGAAPRALPRFQEDPDRQGDAELPYVGDGEMVNSGPVRRDGEPRGLRARSSAGSRTRDGAPSAVNYRLRDWLVSRQRYWGAPIPVIHCEKCGIVPVPDEQLPVVLPEVEDYSPQGRSPLAAAEDWVATECPDCGGPASRETDTMDTFVDSSWYFLRYLDPRNEQAPWDREVAGYWMPVDQYIGGVEHAILHLMYARFFTKALTDMGHLDVQEPFANLFAQGMITRDGAKMSKSRGNTVSPAEIVERYGADSARTYICFMGPPERGGDWTDEGVEGVHRFLARLWRLGAEAAEAAEGAPVAEAAEGDEEGAALALRRKAHWAIDKATRDFERGFQFNTVIAAVMELVNEAYRLKQGLLGEAGRGRRPGLRRRTAASLIQPFAPHLGCEVYERLSGGERLTEQPWPQADPELLQSETVTVAVQVNGKLRDRVEAPADASEAALIELANASANVRRHLDGKEVVKRVVVPGKLVNLVVR